MSKRNTTIGFGILVCVVLLGTFMGYSRIECLVSATQEGSTQMNLIKSQDKKGDDTGSSALHELGSLTINPASMIRWNYLQNMKYCVLHGTQSLHPSSNRTFDTQTWKTYISTERNFKLQVPQEWFVHETQTGLKVDTHTQQSDSESEYFAPFRVEVMTLEHNESIADWLYVNLIHESYDPVTSNILKVPDLDLANADGVRALISGEINGKRWYTYYIRHDNTLYGFSLTNLGWDIHQSDAMLRAIVSTLQFTNEIP